METLAEGLQYYPYYFEAYSAVLGGLVGEYEVEDMDENGHVEWEKRYGLKAFFPLARGFDYSHFDDFGVSRSYGYKRRHLGHDMMGLTGTPIMAIESGRVEALGWNQYGGSVYAAWMGRDIIITPICGKIIPLPRIWRRGAS